MPIELLRAIAEKPLPLKITDASDIDKLRVLRAAGYVSVFLPLATGEQQSASVLLITQKGREAMGSKQPDTA
ncbi:MAG: hypothetical protein V4542_02090 [Pseudomonadota bacterium]